MAKRLSLILLTLSIISIQNLFSQCTDGTQPECQCSTAPVLCTVDDLDNYMFSMSSFQHPQDGPQPLCPGANNTVPNNPTWFAFTAWCTDLTLEASFSNCTAMNGSIGVQIAIYEDCTFTNAVACNVQANACNTNNKTLTMTGLTIGGVYYFLVDGCLGSYCDVTIDIIGVCGEEEIAPWTQGVTGETSACGGNTETYSVEALDGAATYHWFVDGVLVGTSSTPTFDIAWATAGSYELCIDASNDPCVPITDLPEELCTTINVYESDAGTITAPTPLCPNEVATISVTGYTMGSDNAQAILVTDASGVILEVITGATGTYTSATCGTFSLYSYNYIPAIGTAPVVGNNVNTIDCVTECCDLENITISFEDTEPPVFPNPPADETLTCSDLVSPMADLDWTDNCDGMGAVAGTESGSADVCNGGTITRTWEYTDGCGNTATHTQNITVTPAPPPTFTNPPADQTITCDNIPTTAADLGYTNGASGDCEISGMVTPTQSGSADICGGTFSFNWDFTDLCGNTISHTQNITVTPADAPTFINPPADLVVTCDNIPTSAPDLDYTNNENGDCLVMGTISPTQSGTADICGGSFSFNWDFTDICGNSISHTQNITVTPPAAPTFINPPADLVVTCDNIPTSAPDLDYTNNENGDCLVMGTVSPIQSGTADICGGSFSFNWDFTDVCGNNILHTQNITVLPPAPPTFLNPPADLVVTCDDIPTSAPDLSYTNNENGSCLIMGTISPTQSGSADICGGSFSFNWDFTDVCGNNISHTQNITVTPGAIPAFINPPSDQTVACSNIPTGAPDLDYTNNENGNCLVMGSVSPIQSGSADECGGTISYTWTFTDLCNNTITHVQNYTVDPAPPPAFIGSLPLNITVDCDNVPNLPPPLQYTNNENGICAIAGFVSASQSGGYDECGGTIVFLWQFTDDCGRTISHTQNITVDPAPPAVFTNPPNATTLDCSSVPSTLPTLNYTNNESGTCSIDGAVTAIQSGSYDACGGNITYTWTFIDDCNRIISHSQNIVVTPASDPMFTSLPPDISIDCGEPFPTPINLPYTNNETGNCAITGTVPATVTSTGNGGMEYTWTFINPCNNFTITHTQVIDQTPSPDITINPTIVNICEGEMFDLFTVAVTDLNNTSPSITFHSGTPATVSNQLPSPLVSPLTSTTYYILASNSFGCSDETSFDVIVEEPPFAGIDGMGEICYDTPNNINLFSYLLGAYSPNGTWVDTYGYGVNLSNPNNISLQGLPAGSYTFDYVVPSGGVCPDDVASVTLEYLPEIFILPFDILCAADPNFYEVSINNFGFDIIVLSGTYTDLGNNMGIVTDIPIGQSLLIISTNPSNLLCTFTLNIAPPDCNCPNVDPPVSNGDAIICEGETTPQLSVSVGTDETANWYDGPVGGTLLEGGSTTYTSSETAVGIYTYYVETENITSGCVSLTLTPIQFEISENPSGINAQLEECDLDGDGFVEFDLTEANSLISSNTSYTYTYHPSLTDAQNGTGSLSNTFTNTVSPNQTLYVVISNTTNCSSIVEITLTVNPPPSITLQIDDETCLGDGDGSVTINSPTGINFSLDNSNWTANNIFNNLTSGNYTAYVEDGFGCYASQNFDIIDGLEITLGSFDVTCDDNGTASDASDDNYNITFTLTNNNGNNGTYSVFDGNLSVSSLNYNQSNTISFPAQGQSLTLIFTDENTNCSITQEIGPLNSCSTDCSISIDQLDITCSDNGTSNDLTDDFYTVIINSSAINGSANNTYNVLIDGVLNFNYTYNSTSTFTIPADGSSPIISVVDNQDPQCLATQTIGPLVSCSDPCVINFDLVDVVCNDNGTVTDPTDDFYNINIQASAVNSGVSNSFEIFANNISLGTFDYTTGGIFTLPADGSTVLILIQDTDEPLCSADQNIGTLAPCNEDCTINGIVSNIICDDNGTGNDDTDDTFTFDLLVNGQNIGSGWQSTDGTISGDYSITQNFGPFSIADGDLNFDLQDLTTLTCTTSILVNSPATCSDPCVIDFDLVDVICNDNGTVTDPSDDFYEINIQASAVNPGVSNNFEIFVNNISQGTFDYTTGGTFTLPADGNNVIISIQDADEPLCSAEQNIGTLEPCNEDCTINAIISNIVCDDNGTGNDDTDDTFTFDLLVNGQNIGSGWQSTDGTISGDYSNTQTFGPFSIANGDLNFELQDLTTLTCTTSILVNAPSTCSDPCVIGFDLLDFNCNDNGTITDPSDDFYELNIQASAVNPGVSNSFEIFVNNISQGTFDYTTGGTFTLPADGSTILILIQDADEPLCSAEQNIGTLEPCNEDCTINAIVSNIICDDNGTGNDDTDDTFTFDLLVNGQNIGSGWQSTDGTISGGYGIVQNFGSFLITDGDLNLDLQDLTTLICETAISVSVPSTCSTCPQTVDAGIGSTLNCNITIANLNGSSSDVGSYLWTGPNSFSSIDLISTTNLPGWYFLTATYPNNCTAIDSVFIDFNNDTPTANAGPDQTITCDFSEVTLDGSVTSGTNLEFEWTNSSGIIISNQIQITTTTPGIYNLQLTNLVSGCTSTDQVEVFEDTDLPSAEIFADPNNIIDCIVNSITLTSANEPNVVYSWNSIIATQFIVTEGSVINLIALDTISGCENSNQITISDIQDYPLVNLDSPSPISCYEPIIVIDGSSSQLGVNIIYNWFDANNNLITGQNGNTLSVDNGGFYYLQLIDTLNGCENIDSVFVESLLNVPLTQAVEDVTLFCGENETNLNVNILGSTNDLNITWATSNGNIVSGETTLNPLVNQSGVYTVTIQDTISGCVTTDNLEVIINNNVPQIMTANIYNETCFDANDGLISIVNVSGGIPPFTYTLNGNPTDNTGQFQNLPPGIYNIILTDANGCTLEDNFTINPGINLELSLPEVIEILEGNSGTIQALVNVPIDSLDIIQWAPPELLSCDTCLTTTIETLDDQTFQLTIIDNNGCVAIAVINIIVIPQVRIYIPNAFSPNFDGYNDYFTLFSNDQVEEILELSIFDRWGEHVFKKENFQPNDPIIGWDGRLKGEDMNPAVFAYIFEVKLKDGSTRVFSGDVTLTK